MARERYQSYLLRFRKDHEGAPWRVDLEDVHTGRRRAFSSADGAFAYLQTLLGADGSATPIGPLAGGGPESDDS